MSVTVQREQLILRQVEERQRVSVRELSQLLGLSGPTVRKHLDALQSKGLISKVHGAAVSLSGDDEGPFNQRLAVDAPVKQLLGAAAATLVRDGDTVALDSSTTSYHVASHLLDRGGLTVITYSLRVALLFAERSDALVIMPSGTVRRSSTALTGGEFDRNFTGKARIGIFGAASLSFEHGIAEMTEEEAAAKRQLLARCRELVCVCTSNKLDAIGLHTVVDAADIDQLIIDDRAPLTFDPHTLGIRVITVEST